MQFGSQDEELAMKHYIVSLLIRQAKADKDFAPLEEKYLRYATRMLGLKEAGIEAIRQNLADFNVPPPSNEQQRMTILYYLLFMMRADGEVLPQEEQLCYNIGFSLGIRPDLITDLIATMKAYLKQNMPTDAMLEKIKTYLN